MGGFMKTLTLSMIVKNEQEMLAKAIESAMGVDEIVILDTGSEDKTVEIAKKYTNKVYTHYKWNDNFSEARNECKKYCTCEWILMIDADEILLTSVDKIKQIISSKWIEKYDVIIVQVDTGNEITPQPRLFRNKHFLWFIDPVHNRLNYFRLDKGKSITDIKKLNEVGHFEPIPEDKRFASAIQVKAGFSPSHKKDPDRSLRILEKAISENPRNPRFYYYIVREWLVRQEPLKALFYLEKYLKIAPLSNERADAWFIKATIYYDLGEYWDAISACFESVKIMPMFRDPWIMISGLAHPTFKPFWEKVASMATNENVLFKRKYEQENKIIQK